jgi:hypothetical protein
VKYKRIAKNGGQSVVFVEDPTVAASLPAAWRVAADSYAVKLLGGVACRHQSEAWKNRFREKVYYQAKYGFEQAACSAIQEDDHPHAKVCEDRGRKLDPQDFFGTGLVEFAHFKKFAARANREAASDGAVISDRLRGAGTPEEFDQWMRKVGQFRYMMCHKNETDHNHRNWKKRLPQH